MIPKVDLVVLTRQPGPLHPDVERGFAQQRNVQLVVHRVVGAGRAEDRCRWDPIARARNAGKSRGSAPWLMFLDDDVALQPECIATLVEELRRRPAYAAMAADYLGEYRAGKVAVHVSMGATLFRREVLLQLRFQWRNEKCECQCCCDDLRRLHWGIDYCPSAGARHLHGERDGDGSAASSPTATKHTDQSVAAPRVLAAFNRRHFRPFRDRFLTSLRAAGNNDEVIALAMGLYPSERNRLSRHDRLTPFHRPDNGQFVGRQRLRAFQEILSGLPPETPVAYWDAGDVVFQGPLQPLWELVRSSPDKVLATRESVGHPENPAVAAWTQSIADPVARRRACELLYPNAFLNAGFMAATARTLLRYFRVVAPWYDTSRLAGTSDPGDQMALNIFCHSHPEGWREIPESWNYCLAPRNLKTVYRNEAGRYIDVAGLPIYAVHGNANTLQAVPFRRRPF